MRLPGRPGTYVPPRTAIKVELLVRRGLTLRKVSRILGLSFSVVRRVAMHGHGPLPLAEPTDCPSCARPTAVAPCPHCGAAEFAADALATVHPDKQLSEEQSHRRDQIHRDKVRHYTARELEAKYYTLRVHRVGHA